MTFTWNYFAKQQMEFWRSFSVSCVCPKNRITGLVLEVKEEKRRDIGSG